MDLVNSNSNNAAEAGSDQENRVCHGCKLPIEDKFAFHVSPNLEWHTECLSCCECNVFLDENCKTCFVKDGRLYCRSDYFNLFGVKCARCCNTIHANTLVMRAEDQIYHTDCFRCFSCDKKLSSGEQYGVASGKVYCKTDYDSLPQELINSPSEHGSDSGNLTSGTRKTPIEKQPRIRTVLTEQQLQTLRSVYSNNPRPDALLKEQLCELTGLSPRVIRVWFQNRRCKDKKKAIQAEAARMQSMQPMQQGNKVIPGTPQPPMTPDGISQMSPHGPIPVFTYPSHPAPSYEHISPQLSTVITSSTVSPVVTIQHTPAWGSPSDTISPFVDTTVDFSSPITTDHHQQSFVFSSSQSHMPQPTTITHFPF